MDNMLENFLFKAIEQQNIAIIIRLLHQGANPNALLSNGKTCLMEAVSLQNINILKLLLDKDICSLSSPTSASQKNCYKKKKSQKRKHNSHSDTGTSFTDIPSKYFQVENVADSEEMNFTGHRNRGYYVFIHDDESSTEESNYNFQPTSVVTPPASELEWDEELGPHPYSFSTTEDDPWSSMYKWYAEILETTGPVLVTASNCKFTIDQQDLVEKTALHYAVDRENTEAMKILIGAGCKIDVPDLSGYTPLHYAILNGYLEGVNILLGAGSRINQTTPQKTSSMHLAALSRDIKMVKRVVEAGGRLDDRDTFDRNPLSVAARNGSIDIIKYLISLGVAVNSENSRGSTSLCEAVHRNHTNVVELLLKAGARVTHSRKLLHTAVSHRNVVLVGLLVKSATGGLNLCDERGNTALLKATRYGLRRISKILLEHGANVRTLNKLNGEHVLHTAVFYLAKASLFEDFLLLFMQYNIDINSTGLTNITAFRKALLRENYIAAAILIKHGAKVNALTNRQNNLKWLIHANRSPDLVRLMIAAGHRQVLPASSLTLLALCRLRVRRFATEQPVYLFIESLPLPAVIKKFLMFETEVEAVILNTSKKIRSPVASDREQLNPGSSSDSS